MDETRISPRLHPLIVAALVLAFTGCQSLTRTQAGAMVGSGLGGLAGGAIGHQSGNTAGGALFGAAAGGLVGALAGNAADANAQHEQAERELHRMRNRAAAQALTNFDLIKLSSSGVSDEVIIESIKIRGGRFDLSAESIIALQRSGVSDQVILAAQQARQVPDADEMMYSSGRTMVVRSSPDVVYVPSVVVGPRFWWGPPRPPMDHRHCGPRPW